MVADTDHALQGWVVWTYDGSRQPLALTLPDQPYDDETSQAEAHSALRQASRALHQQMLQLTLEQVAAVAQQAESDYDGLMLVQRTLRYWDRPRLVAVDWLRVSPEPGTTTAVAKFVQHFDGDLTPGQQVMLAGDSFADVHATVLEDQGDHWLVRTDPDSM